MIDMIRTFYTPQGRETRELTKEEVDTFAQSGDIEAKKEKAGEKLALATTITHKIDAVIEFLGV